MNTSQNGIEAIREDDRHVSLLRDRERLLRTIRRLDQQFNQGEQTRVSGSNAQPKGS
jgi:hypothetical protein